MTKTLQRAFAALLLLCISLQPALAADTKISAMPSATTLNGTEVVPGVQSAANVKISAAQIKTFVQSAVTTQTGTTYTGVLADANTWIRFNNAAAITFTIPTNATVAYPVGTVIEFSQAGAGAVTVAAASGVTLNSRGGAVSTAGIYAVASLKQVATDTWVLSGDIM